MIAHGGGTLRDRKCDAPAAFQLFAKDTFTGGADLRRMLWRNKKLNRNTLRASSSTGRRDGWRVCMTGQYLGGCRTRRAALKL